MSAAAGAKRADETSEVTVFEKGRDISYGSCGLPYFIADKDQKPEKLTVFTPETAEKKKGIKVRINSEVEKIDIKRKKVIVKDVRGGGSAEYDYDRLIIASGSVPVSPGINGIDRDNVFFLKTLEDGIKLKKFMQTKNPESAVIIGDGHIAFETAENFKKAGIKDITIMGKNRHICWWLDKDIAEVVKHTAEKNGIKVMEKRAVDKITHLPGGRSKVISGSQEIETDMVFISLGMRPNSELARAAGIKTDSRGCIDVNEYMETSVPDVYAAGDCANVFFIPEKKYIFMPRGTTANKQGRIAGYNAAGIKRAFGGITGVMIFKFFHLETARAGLSEEMAVLKKIDVVSAHIRSRTHAAYYPGSERIHVKITADRKTKKIIGAQITGGRGSGKRIDILSLALYNEMEIEKMKDMDMAYAPPFAPVWDPVLIAVNALAKELA